MVSLIWINRVQTTVQDVIMAVYAMNIAVSVSVAQDSMAQRVKISVIRKRGALNASQGSKNKKFQPKIGTVH